MSRDRVKQIIDELNTQAVGVLDRLSIYQDKKYERLWQQDARLYRAFGWKLIRSGHPTRAYELVREGLHLHDDPELKYLCALALARGKNISMAAEVLDDLMYAQDLEMPLAVDVWSLAGRLYKDRYQRSGSVKSKVQLARQSAELYERAYKQWDDSFPGINAASMSVLAGRRKKSIAIAKEVIRKTRLASRKTGRRDDYWLLATLGEAHVIIGDMEGASRWFAKAVRCAAGNVGDIASMRRNVLLLKERIPVSDDILDIFAIGTVLVFSGHMIDHPSRSESGLAPRFPSDRNLERRVADAIDIEIGSLNGTVGYCSAACGSDLLFAEQMLKRDAELHVVLPFDKSDFYYTSVDFGLDEMREWRKRCDRVLEKAYEIHYATTERFLGDEVLFDFINRFIQGLAIARSLEMGVEPLALMVLDPSSGKLAGGASDFLAQWKKRGRSARVIDLSEIRSNVSTKPNRTKRTRASHSESDQDSHLLQMGVETGHVRRQVKAMVFADVKNFSKLSEEQAPAFFYKFLNEVARVIQGLHHAPTFCNTWGDGLYLVFDAVVDSADFAMRLLDRLEKVKWTQLGLPSDTTVRIGLHAGPVYPRKDAILQRRNFFGSHVNRAARIEPVTIPGCAYTSEQFAALLAVDAGDLFTCEYVGVEDLAKEYDRCPLYRLSRTVGPK